MAPVDRARSRRLSGSVYSLRILPLSAERHPRQQRDHLQRPAQIAEIMHFPPRPDLLSERAADPGVMHAVHHASSNGCACTVLHPARARPCARAPLLC